MAVPKDAYVLSQIWGCEKVPGSEFIANLGLVKRVIKQRKSVTLTRERESLYIYTLALSDTLYLKTGCVTVDDGEKEIFLEKISSCAAS